MNSGKERNDADSKGSSEVSTGRGVQPPSPASAQAMEGSRAFQKGNYSCWGCQKFPLSYTVREMASFGGVFGVVVLAVMLPCLDVALGQSTDPFEVIHSGYKGKLT